MLKVDSAGKDFHHAHIRNANTNEGGLYQTLEEASEANPGTNCYILSSTTEKANLQVGHAVLNSKGESTKTMFERHKQT